MFGGVVCLHGEVVHRAKYWSPCVVITQLFWNNLLKVFQEGSGARVPKCSRLVSRKAQNKDVYRRTIEILQRAHIFKVNCFLKVYNAHLKLALAKFGISHRSRVLRENWQHLGLSPLWMGTLDTKPWIPIGIRIELLFIGLALSAKWG